MKKTIFLLIFLSNVVSPIRAACSPSCINGGTCDGSVCSCQDGFIGAFCQFSKPYLSAILHRANKSIIAFWPLTKDFGASDMFNLHNPIDGTIIGGSIPFTVGPYGVANSAIQTATAPNRYLEFNSASISLSDVAPAGWTFSMWANVPTSGEQTLLCFRNPVNLTQDGLRYAKRSSSSSGHIVWPLYGGIGNDDDSDSCEFAISWEYLSITYDEQVVDLVCATNNVDPVPGGDGPPRTYSKMVIGYRPSSNAVSIVNVACLSLHSKHLTAAELAATRDLCKYFSYQCDGITCTGGKVCNGLGICDCPPGYIGTNCTSYDCYPVCANGGTCTGPFNCTCTTGWTGSFCQEPICTSPCHNGGSCSAPETCTCLFGYTGVQCETGHCPCYNGGSCIGASDYCDCPSTHYGQLCEFTKTNIQSLLNAAALNLVGYWPFTHSMRILDATANAIHGTMVSNITYQTGPYGVPGTSIQTTPDPSAAYVYFNSALLDFDATSSSWTWGTWIHTQTSGTAYFFQYVAATSTSLGTYLYQSGSLLYFYSAYGSKSISCNMYSGWTYIAVYYDKSTRQGKFYCGSSLLSTIINTSSIAITHPRVFLGYRPSTAVGYSVRFACMSAHKAVLSSSQITAVRDLCKYFSVSCSNCANGGTCFGYQLCQCATGWSGPNCTVTSCTPACTGNRYCSAPNVCSCNAGWTGANCTEPVCNATCQNGGTCTSPNTCTCPSGWMGSTCATFTCSPSCLNGGTCTGSNTCSCNGSYTGSICQTPVCSQGCDYGNCTSPNVCTCYGGFSGSSCNISACSPVCINGGICIGSLCQCPSNFTGKYCQFATPFIQDVLVATSSNLVAFWPLNNDFGVNDAYAYQVNGSVPITMTYSTGPYGKSQSAITTTYSPYQYVTFSSALLDVGVNNGSWTLAMWIKTPSTTSAPIWHFYSPTSNSTEGLRLIQNSVNTLYVHSNGNFKSWSCNMSGVWQFVAISYLSANKTLSAFCDNAFLTTSFLHTTNPTTYSRVYMGFRPYSPASHTLNFACTSLHSASLTTDQLLVVKDACRYFTLSCTSACLNGGSCVGSDVCSCPSGFQGAQCQSAICNPTCSNGGSCSSPNFCTCLGGYTGSACETAICSSPCQNGGNCTSPNTCTCPNGWTGPACQQAVCTAGCQNGGSCILPDTCSCLTTWSGSNCQNPICEPDCLNGNCTSPDNCTCETGWIGGHCHKAVCGSIGCANLGNCTAPDVCVCQPGWTGFECETAICTQTCQNNGTCTAPDTCTCLAGWTGQSCDTPICTSPCFNGGNCTGPDICSCTAGFSGTLCENGICSPSCQHGNCTGPNICSCESGWDSADCSAAICNQTCLNGASCSSPNTCTCMPGYSGSSCETPVCNPSCTVNGVCTSPDGCACQAGWTDFICSSAICNLGCLNGGSCSAPETCTCTTGWTGEQCDVPICAILCNSQGGDCSAPDTCTCHDGWMGSLCETPVCSEPCQNDGSCTQPEFCACSSLWEGDHCEIEKCPQPCQHGNCSNWLCVCEDHWAGSQCENAICDIPCENNGSCIAPNVCSCLLGFKGAHCENHITTVTVEDITNLSDEQLLQNIGPVKNVFLSMAATVSDTKAPEKVTEMLGSLSSMLDRFGNVTDMPPEKFADIASACSSAADAMLTAVTSEATASDEDDGPKYEEQTMKCKVEADGKLSAVEPSKPPPTADAKEKMRKMFNSFMSMLVNMFSNLRAVLKPGTNMTFSGEFYGATVFNVRLRDVPGLVLDTNLATATFPKVDDVYMLFGPMPAKCSTLSLDSTIPVILSAFVVNVMDVDKPFNMPTVAVRMYCPEQEELVLNKAHATKIVAKPSQKKAALFNNQKKDAQCDVSKVRCDLTENADAMGSMATFPVKLDAGDFVLIFPNIEYNYSAYISFNSTPSANKYNIQANVSTTEVSLIQNGTFEEPRWHYRPQKDGDLRIIISEKAINQFIETLPPQEEPKISIYVFTKRNFSAFASLEELPASACELQRTFGYHLRIGLAKDDSTKKVRRAIDDSTLDGFQLEPESTESAVVFKSSYFGDFGADLAVSPNTIEFSDIFANFSTLVANNAGVLAFQCAAIALFLVGVGICWKFDREDLKEWAFLPIKSNQRHQHVRYLISVHFMNVKNFKLKPKISLRLIGNVYDTTWRILEDGVRKKIFDGRHPANFTLTTQVTVGRIDAIELMLEQKRETGRTGIKGPLQMYIDRVVVVDAERGLKYVYLVKSKLKSGDKVKTALATEDEMKGYTYLISGHSRASITDIHPWLSTMKRPLPSNWTRVERLACVVAALFMAMLVNGMFYGKEATAPKVGLKIGGFFKLSWFTLWTSFIGCVIVIPPTAVIAFIFKKIKRRSAEKSAFATVFNVKVNEATSETTTKYIEDERDEKKKKPFELPYWTVIIAWIIVASCIGTSAFLVVMYSLSWGQEKSLAWLSGMILNVIQDIILIQPIKVVLTSIFSATLHSLPDDGLNVGKLTYNPRNNRKKVELFYRLRGVMTGIFHHAIYVVIFTIVIATMTSRYSFLQIDSLRPILNVKNVPTFHGSLRDSSQIFVWLNETALPMVLNGNQLEKGGIFYSANALYRVPNPNIALLGPIRLTQQRVSSTPCLVDASIVPAFVKRYSIPLTRRYDGNDSMLIQCQTAFGNADGSERKVFNGSWSEYANPQGYWKAVNLTYFEAPWVYRETEGNPYSGWEATYNTGGYYIDLPKKLSNARTVLDYLRHSKWLDNATNSLFVEFNLFNVQTNLFIPVKVVFEALSAGGMSYHIRMFPLQLYMYSGASSMLNFIVQGLWVLLLLSHVVRVCRALKKEGRKVFFANGWNILDVIQVLLGLGIVIFFAARIYVVIGFITKIQTMRSTYINLDLLASWEDLLFCLFGIEFFLAMFCFFRHLTVNKHWAVFMGTLSNGKLDLATYGSIFALATILFAGIAYLVMGQDFWSFSTYPRAILCLIGSIIGSMTFNAFDSPFYLILTMLYTAVVVFLGTNVFVTLIMAAYSDVTVDIEHKTTWDSELSDYMAVGVKEILFRKKEENLVEKPKEQPFRPVGEKNCAKLEMVIQRFSKYMEKRLETFTSRETAKLDRSQLLWVVDIQEAIRNSRNTRRPTRPVSMHNLRSEGVDASQTTPKVEGFDKNHNQFADFVPNHAINRQSRDSKWGTMNLYVPKAGKKLYPVTH